MKEYDDFAVNLSNFETMAKEYNAKIQSKALGVDSLNVDEKDIKNLFNKVEYLRVVVSNLKKHTTNSDILLVLDDVITRIVSQNNTLTEILSKDVIVESQSQDEFKMFCNNLKIAIGTSSEIVKILIDIKDSNNIVAEIKPELTESINSFLDINNSLVSLFGECRYLRYR